MTDMTDLWLRSNQLSGPVPNLSGMTSLNILKLQDNDLDGGVPDGSMLPPNATWILLQQNNLGGGDSGPEQPEREDPVAAQQRPDR